MKRAALVFAFGLFGCFRMTVHNGLPVGNTPIEYDPKWHHGAVFGIAELSGPYDLSKICPRGWAEIHTETSFLNGLLEAITDNIYTPQSVTVRCAAR
jgi:Bor protein